ncbi:MAG TPA: redoxin domain-containing protein [Terriglobales bacterium]|nr:redoxin domain-containing protein [Terriglobales bacterium]
MKAFQQNLQKLEAADTQVLGVSVDSPFSNNAWGRSMGVTFPLLSDMGGSVIQEYGLGKTYTIAGVKMESARRATFLIGKDGKILNIQVDNDAVDPTKTVEACQARRLKE